MVLLALWATRDWITGGVVSDGGGGGGGGAT